MAKQFTPSTNYLKSAVGGSVDGNSDYTIAGWVYVVTTTSGCWYDIFAIYRNANRSADHDYIFIADFGAGPSFLIESNTGGAGFLVGAGAGSATAGVWRHVAMVRSGTTVYMYINGTVANSGTNDASSRGVIDTFSIGETDLVATGEDFIAEGFKVWSRALSAEELLVESRAIMPISRHKLFAAYPLIDGDNNRDFAGSNALTATGTLAASQGLGLPFRHSANDKSLFLAPAAITNVDVTVQPNESNLQISVGTANGSIICYPSGSDITILSSAANVTLSKVTTESTINTTVAAPVLTVSKTVAESNINPSVGTATPVISKSPSNADIAVTTAVTDVSIISAANQSDLTIETGAANAVISKSVSESNLSITTGTAAVTISANSSQSDLTVTVGVPTVIISSSVTESNIGVLSGTSNGYISFTANNSDITILSDTASATLNANAQWSTITTTVDAPTVSISVEPSASLITLSIGTPEDTGSATAHPVASDITIESPSIDSVSVSILVEVSASDITVTADTANALLSSSVSNSDITVTSDGPAISIIAYPSASLIDISVGIVTSEGSEDADGEPDASFITLTTPVVGSVSVISIVDGFESTFEITVGDPTVIIGTAAIADASGSTVTVEIPDVQSVYTTKNPTGIIEAEIPSIPFIPSSEQLIQTSTIYGRVEGPVDNQFFNSSVYPYTVDDIMPVLKELNKINDNIGKLNSNSKNLWQSSVLENIDSSIANKQVIQTVTNNYEVFSEKKKNKSGKIITTRKRF